MPQNIWRTVDVFYRIWPILDLVLPIDVEFYRSACSLHKKHSEGQVDPMDIPIVQL